MAVRLPAVAPGAGIPVGPRFRRGLALGFALRVGGGLLRHFLLVGVPALCPAPVCTCLCQCTGGGGGGQQHSMEDPRIIAFGGGDGGIGGGPRAAAAAFLG